MKIFFSITILIALITYSIAVCIPFEVGESVNTTTDAQFILFDSTITWIDEEGQTIEERFELPDGYTRTKVDPNSFGYFLRRLPLKPHGYPVRYYHGNINPHSSHEAVFDLPIGRQDLHQCADAIIRLRADYLRQQGRQHDIHFNFTNGHKVAYTQWMSGKRIKVRGNKSMWIDGATQSDSDESYWAYLETIFMYAGTYSLSKELVEVALNEMQIGDIFIQGGHPGHAIVVVDMAYHEERGEKIYLLAQSYMPAQELHVLSNLEGHLGPWYSTTAELVSTPDWIFRPEDLKRFDQP